MLLDSADSADTWDGFDRDGKRRSAIGAWVWCWLLRRPGEPSGR